MNRLKVLRENNNISIDSLAKYLNITNNEYLDYENEDIELNEVILRKLAKFYDTSIDYILFETDDNIRH